MNYHFQERTWWNYIERDLQELFEQAQVLTEKADEWGQKFQDYAFVVFPAAKAYEGFLKKLFLDLGFISEEEYYGKRFRIGRALNPSLEKKIREKESVYDKIVNYCNSDELATKLWEAWKSSRNLLFHWFPKEKNTVTLNQAKERTQLILDAMDTAFKECRLEK